MLLTLGWPYDPDARRPDTRVLFEAAQPDGVVVASHLSARDAEWLLNNYSDLLWLVRLKGGRGWMPQELDSREWADEQSATQLLERLLARGVEPLVVCWNEPDIEWVRDGMAPDGRWWSDVEEERQAAWDRYRELTSSYLYAIRERWGGRVKVALAPLSQGNPERFDWWSSRYLLSGLLHRSDFVAEHNYTDGRAYDDPDWGGRWRRWDAMVPNLPIHIKETNDNGAFFAASPGERAEDYAAYARHLRHQAQIIGVGPASLGLFILPGGKGSHPAWWDLTPEIITAVRAVMAEPLAQPAPPTVEEPPVPDTIFTSEDVLVAAHTRSDELSLPRVLMVALGIAESELQPSARRPVDPADDSTYWPDVSMGAWQQTVRFSAEYAGWCAEHNHDPNIMPGPDVVAAIGDQYYDVWLASWRASRKILEDLWQSDPWPDRSTWNPRQCSDALLLEAMNRYNSGREVGPNDANYRRALTEAYRLLGETPAAPAEQPDSYDPGVENFLQAESWTCAPTSLATALRSLALSVTPAQVIDGLGRGRVTPELGLLDGSGAGLVAYCRELGIEAEHAWLSWDQVAALAGTRPVLLGGQRWYHWTFVRAYDADSGVFALGNPAPSWRGVGQWLDRVEWDAWGGWACVWLTGGVAVPPAAPAPLPEAPAPAPDAPADAPSLPPGIVAVAELADVVVAPIGPLATELHKSRLSVSRRRVISADLQARVARARAIREEVVGPVPDGAE